MVAKIIYRRIYLIGTCDTLTSPQSTATISPPILSTEENVTHQNTTKPIQDVVKSIIDFLAAKLVLFIIILRLDNLRKKKKLEK